MAASLRELGVDARGPPGAPTRHIAGVVAFTARDAPRVRSSPIKVYGQDAYDNRLLAKVWRTLWYRDGGPQLGLSRLQAVEHEALMTLLAVRAGFRTREVVTASGKPRTGTPCSCSGGRRDRWRRCRPTNSMTGC